MGVFTAKKEVGGYRIEGAEGVEATIRPLTGDAALVKKLADNIAALYSGKSLEPLAFNGLSINYRQGKSTLICARLGQGISVPQCEIMTKDGVMPDRTLFDLLNSVELSGQRPGAARKRGGPRRSNAASNPRQP